MSKSLDDLNQWYRDSETANAAIHAEQRSNVLLTAGEHYSKRAQKYWRNIRGSSSLNENQKIRLTKNHTQKIVKGYINNLLHYAPDVKVGPRNKSEFHDQKVAEHHESVWRDLKKRNKFSRFRYYLAKDFTEIGELWVKCFFDPSAGEFIAYEAEQDEEGRFVVVDDVPEHQKVFEGGVIWERYAGFDVLTDSAARSFDDCREVTLRKMVPTKNLLKQFKGDDEKISGIKGSSKQTYMLFDPAGGGYKRSSDGLTMVRETYCRPSAEYENGYYWIWVEGAVLHEGPLPHGIFPIIHQGFDEATTSARSYSIIKTTRPYQAEINRTASKIAEHQVTLGDDKLVTQPGATLTPGAAVFGVKHIKAGGQVTHLPGRNGEQFVDYMNGQIAEMYSIANMLEDSEEKRSNDLDPYALLFRAMKDKKKFSLYGDKFEEALVELCEKSLRYAKADYTDDMVIQVLDKKERVNIEEFRSSDDLSTEIVVDKQSEDIETRLGQQLVFNHFLQFVGNKLDPKELGQVARAMPFLNKEAAFEDLTIDADNVLSDILAMDRGDFVPANRSDDHGYYIKKLEHRKKRKDYQFLPEYVKSNYEIKIEQHLEFETQLAQQAAMASRGAIPSGGFMVKCDVRIPDPNDPTKTSILKLPVEAVGWLIKKLEEQGSSQQVIEGLPMSAQADIGMKLAAIPEMQGDIPQGAGSF